jgi:IS30 family transposase
LTERESKKKYLPFPVKWKKMFNFASLSKKVQNMGKHLTEVQRYEISAMLQAEMSRKEICEQIGRDKSVLSRELRRNCDKRTRKYNADLAQRKYEQRLSEKPKFVHFTEEIKQKIINELNNDFSPEQIAGRAKLEGRECVSHETIYQFVWQDKKRGGELHKHLRNRGKKYGKRGSYKSSRGIIKNRVSIEERPEIVDEKVRFGDLEIDTIIGKNHKGAILTITERVSLMEWIAKLSGKDAKELAEVAIKILQPFQNHLHTITSDNGKEFALHEVISENLKIDFYFAHPYKSCERGCNENANRLIRQYIPKKTDFDTIDNQYVEWIQNKLNNRPRKKLGFLTPNEYFLLSLQNRLIDSEVAFVT